MATDGSSRSSIARAAALLQQPADQNRFIILKLLPDPRGCCCFHCWPDTWAAINAFIAPDGPIPDEGDALIHSAEGPYVLECHESGPEIVVYLGVATAFLVLAKSVVDLITAFLKGLAEEHRRSLSRIKLTHRRVYTGEVADDILIEIDLPLADDIAGTLSAMVREVLEKRGTDPCNPADCVQPPASRPSAHNG